MIQMSLAEIAAATGGTVHGDPTALVTGAVVTDARESEAGSLYVARVGEHADGHDYAGQAAERGASAALATRVVDELDCIVVDDTQAAFVALSRALLERLPDLHVVGITGSSGKTSTKDLLGSVLAASGETIAPQGSYNSEVGVPLTVCRVTEGTRYLVVEMGARGIGHVEYLTLIAPPQVGIVLNVGHAHVGEFGSIDQVALAKSELVEALPADGVAVLNADDPRVRAMAEVTRARVVLVGESPDAEVRATDVILDEGGRPRFTVVAPFGTAEVSLPLVGRHHVGNALAVIAAAQACGLDLETIVAALVGAARILCGRREELAGDVVLMFQPAEEGPGGAEPMLAEGLLRGHHLPRSATAQTRRRSGARPASPDCCNEGGLGPPPRNISTGPRTARCGRRRQPGHQPNRNRPTTATRPTRGRSARLGPREPRPAAHGSTTDPATHDLNEGAPFAAHAGAKGAKGGPSGSHTRPRLASRTGCRCLSRPSLFCQKVHSGMVAKLPGRDVVIDRCVVQELAEHHGKEPLGADLLRDQVASEGHRGKPAQLLSHCHLVVAVIVLDEGLEFGYGGGADRCFVIGICASFVGAWQRSGVLRDN